MPYGATGLGAPYRVTKISAGETLWEAELDEAPWGPPLTIGDTLYQPAWRAGAPSEELLCYPIDAASGTVGDMQTLTVATPDTGWEEAVEPPDSPCNGAAESVLSTWSPLDSDPAGYFPSPNYQLTKFLPGTFCGFLWETGTDPARLISRVVNAPQIVCHNPVTNAQAWTRQGWAEYPDLYELYSTLLVHANRLLCWVQRWSMDTPVEYDYPSETTEAIFTEFMRLGQETGGVLAGAVRQLSWQTYCVPSGAWDGKHRVPLLGPGIITSVIVKNTADTVTYTEGTHYNKDLVGGWLERINGSGIPSTVKVYQSGTVPQGYKQPALTAGTDWTFTDAKLTIYETGLLALKDQERSFAIPNKLEQGFLTLNTADGTAVAENLVDLRAVDSGDSYAVVTAWRVIRVSEHKAAGTPLAFMEVTQADMEAALGASELYYWLGGEMVRSKDFGASQVGWTVLDQGSTGVAPATPNEVEIIRMGLAYTYEMRDVQITKRAPFDPLLVAASGGRVYTNAGGSDPVVADYHTEPGESPL